MNFLLQLLTLFSVFLFAVVVRLLIKTVKKVKEKGWLSHSNPEKERRVASLLETENQKVQRKNRKLAQLHLCEIPFPPKIGLHVRPQRGQAKVGVHAAKTKFLLVNILKSF